jgi:hypothetical protein
MVNPDPDFHEFSFLKCGEIPNLDSYIPIYFSPLQTSIVDGEIHIS